MALQVTENKFDIVSECVARRSDLQNVNWLGIFRPKKPPPIPQRPQFQFRLAQNGKTSLQRETQASADGGFLIKRNNYISIQTTCSAYPKPVAKNVFQAWSISSSGMTNKHVHDAFCVRTDPAVKDAVSRHLSLAATLAVRARLGWCLLRQGPV